MSTKLKWIILLAVVLLPVILAAVQPNHDPTPDYDPLKHIGEAPPYFDLATGRFNLSGEIGEGSKMPPATAVFIYRLLMTWVIIGVVLVFAARATKRFSMVPGRVQGLGEVVVDMFDTLAKDTLGDKARSYFPLVTTLFMFILLSNWIGMLPKVWEYLGLYIGSIVAAFDPGVHVVGKFLNWYIEVPDGHWLSVVTKLPHFEEPTADLNTTLGCGLIVFFTAHAAGIKHSGFGPYFKSTFCEIDIPGAKYFPVLYIPIVILGALGELGKLVSHSFRLFGNILGGSVVMLVVITLMMRLVYVLPVAVFLQVGMNLFLGLFVGAVQAFVFAMLAMVYIAIKIPLKE
ncbi:MAG: F0F1 ATP synthase subunit A [Verrucomicrobia bacterium]|nr:F0F1 ATP synthase subunit A [Verrucomicrobiota bacterium]